MCRNIKVLFNSGSPTRSSEIHDAAKQFVRKVSGFREPSKANEIAFEEAVNQVSKATQSLLSKLVSRTTAHKIHKHSIVGR